VFVREKVEIIRKLECGEKNVFVCKKKFNLSSTVLTLWKNKEQILSAFEKNLSTKKKDEKMLGLMTMTVLLEWFKVQRDAGFPMNKPILRIRAENCQCN
jgi:hypothetical protein